MCCHYGLGRVRSTRRPFPGEDLIVIAFVLGVAVGATAAVVAVMLLDRSARRQQRVLVSMLRNPRTTLRFWLDPQYREVTREMRRVFGPQ